MECPECQTRNRERRRFCAGCGAPLTALCSVCGFVNEAGEGFCGGCGGQLSWGGQVAASSGDIREGERKQVTVLFADVVGSTPLAERFDPETVREMIEGCFEVLTREIERYGGTVNQFTGDGLMALFGAPVTWEDHAARGVHAAWGIQQAMAGYEETVRRRWDAPFQLRLGLNTGLVLVGQVRGFEMDFTAIGDTVNLAARLQQAAPAGGIWASDSTHRSAGPAFGWRPVGPLELKGKSGSVTAYEVTGLGSAQGRFEVLAQRGLTRFVGRDTELAQLLSAWERALTRHGQVVSVVGEAGLGKSRLLHEFKQHLAQRGALVYEGSCFAYGEITPYLPFLQVLRAVFDLDPATTVSDARNRVDSHLAGVGIGSETAAFLHHLLSHPTDADPLAQLAPAVLRQRTVEALRHLLVAEAAVRPVVLVVEDVHWIDAASQEVLSALAEAMSPVPLLLVLAYRPEYLHAWAEGPNHAEISLAGLADTGTSAMVRAILSRSFAESVALEPLSAEESQAIVHDLLGTAFVPREFEELVANRTDGNPLFVEELTRSLLESGDLVRHGDGYALTRPPEALEIPTSVQGVLIQRVDRLDAELKSLLQIASVLGRVFTYPLLSAVAQLDGGLERNLAELGEYEFIHPTSLAEREYSFKHVLTQEAVYDTLLRSRREAYHERAGKALEALYSDRLEEHYERLAFHYTRSPNADKAVEYLDLANQKAARAYAMAEARTYLEQAMQLLDRMPDTAANQRRRISLLANQFYVFFYLHRPLEYLEVVYPYEALAREQGDLDLLGRFYQCVGFFEMYLGDGAKALATLDLSVEASEAGGDEAAAGTAYSSSAFVHMWLDNYDEAVSQAVKALAVFDTHFELHWYLWAHMSIGMSAAKRGRWAEAIAECEEGLRVGYEYQDDSVVCFSAFILSMSYTWWGEVERAVEFAQLALEKAATPADQAWSTSFLAYSLCRAGEAERAVELLASLVPHYGASGFSMMAVGNGTFLGEAYWRAGRLEEARGTLDATGELALQAGLRFYLGQAQRLLGEVAWQADPTPEGAERAAAHFGRSLAVLREIGAENELALAHAGYGRLCHQRGQTAEARQHLTRALEIFDRLGTLGEPERTRATLAELTGSQAPA